MDSVQYEPIETYLGGSDLDKISLDYNLDSGSEENNSSKSKKCDSPPKDENLNNPLLNVNTLQSLRISHSIDKSTDSQTLINRINGIKSTKDNLINEKEYDLYIDMYDLLNNKENDFNQNNIIEKTCTKHSKINKLNRNINSNKNINSTKNTSKSKNSKKNLSLNKIKNTKSNPFKKQINIQQLFKKKFEERTNYSKKQSTTANSSNKYNNYSSNNSLLQNKISRDFVNHKDFSLTTENSNKNISKSYFKRNNNEYLVNLLTENKEETIKLVNDKNIMISELDFKLSPSSHKKKVRKNEKIVHLKQKHDIKKYLFNRRNSFNHSKNKNKKSINNSCLYLITTTQNNINNNKIIYNETEISPRIIKHKTNNYILIKKSIPKKTKNPSNSCKADKIKLISNYFFNNKVNNFFQNKNQIINHIPKSRTCKRKIDHNSYKNLSLNNIKLNNKIKKRNDIPNCIINNKIKIPANFNKKMRYLNLSKENSKQSSVKLNHSSGKNKLIKKKIHSMKTMNNVLDKNQNKKIIKGASQKTKQWKNSKEVESYFNLLNDIMIKKNRKISTNNINISQRSHKNININNRHTSNNAVKYFINNN